MKSKHKSRKEKADDFRPNPVEALYHSTKRMIEMETQLKTLKDLKSHSFDTGSNEWISMVELRQEAIKWVKVFRSYKDMGYSWATKHEMEGAAEQFMKFFNLTSEDLK